MTSYQSDPEGLFVLDPRDEAVAHFISMVGRQLQDAFLHRRNDESMTQQDLAAVLGVDRSRIHRCLSGSSNLTLESVAELVWALRGEPRFSICMEEQSRECNHATASQLNAAISKPASTTAAVATFYRGKDAAAPTRTLELAR